MTDNIGKTQKIIRLELPENTGKINPVNHSRQAKAGPEHIRDQQVTRMTGNDRVDLSSEAMEVWLANQAVKSMPDIRMGKVSNVQRQVTAGVYKIEGERIAFSMLNESMENNSILNRIDTMA